MNIESFLFSYPLADVILVIGKIFLQTEFLCMSWDSIFIFSENLNNLSDVSVRPMWIENFIGDKGPMKDYSIQETYLFQNT
jgi:hypothetical protein